MQSQLPECLGAQRSVDPGSISTLSGELQCPRVMILNLGVRASCLFCILTNFCSDEEELPRPLSWDYPILDFRRKFQSILLVKSRETRDSSLNTEGVNKLVPPPHGY